MHKPIKYVEKGLTIVAKGAWGVFDTLNGIKPNPSITPTAVAAALRPPKSMVAVPESRPCVPITHSDISSTTSPST